MRYKKEVVQIANFLPDRKGWDNPQEGRVYDKRGLSPSIRNDSRYWIIEARERHKLKTD